MLNLMVNGKSFQSSAPLSVAELLLHLQCDAARVAVEHNGIILQGEHFATTPLADGDRLEIVQFVGGG
ncbi:sulfur carrier protein ThiS [Desulfuromonas sp. CSMB_57]|jgi:thiamine biosynthesis protein ThiS|uniref:sulfur carrier protein ThiS n=1 Tax=Desulfuromonas sp. CSMB_57 TaxID=2807629 RepID=UPI001CD4DBC7|nr:sulfur carrier protein ThiS [Desulfuromonas sp. CSMB_57]